MNSGLALNSSENSSTMTSRVGRGGSCPPARRAFSYSNRDECPLCRRASWRRVISPLIESCIRSTSGSSSARLVITAEVWGSFSMLRKVAPPLKSTRTRLRISDECVAARAHTSVRSSSLLPDPVAPISIPCGPMPPWADSLRSISTTSPSSVTPIGTWRRVRCAALWRHWALTSKVCTSRMASNAVSSKSLSNGRSTTSMVPLVRLGASTRARVSACGRPSESAVAVPISSSPAG